MKTETLLLLAGGAAALLWYLDQQNTAATANLEQPATVPPGTVVVQAPASPQPVLNTPPAAQPVTYAPSPMLPITPDPSRRLVRTGDPVLLTAPQNVTQVNPNRKSSAPVGISGFSMYGGWK